MELGLHPLEAASSGPHPKGQSHLPLVAAFWTPEWSQGSELEHNEHVALCELEKIPALDFDTSHKSHLC